MTTFAECFSIILTGDREASREASRRVRKLVYNSAIGHKTVVDKFCLTWFLGYAIIKPLKPPALILSNQNTAGF